MKAQDQYLKFVKLEETDALYVGYCPDLFPWGGVCHAETEEDNYKKISTLVEEEIVKLESKGKPLPPPSARPMREAIPA
ncbi:MAG TPA: pilus assembly protein HicB [Verrucomicrobiales bacterium]|nr:pilus assembly protein HicB [Verrucomicrobiales bacterium]